MKKVTALFLILLLSAQGMGRAQENNEQPRHPKTKAKQKLEPPQITISNFSPISSSYVGTGKSPELGYFHDGIQLKSFHQFQEVIDPLKDYEASRLLRAYGSQESTGAVIQVIGGLLIAGGGVYNLAAQGPTVNSYSPFRGETSYTEPADTTAGWVVIGVGFTSFLLGSLLKADSGANLEHAVTRYNRVAEGGAPAPTPTAPVTAEKAKEAALAEKTSLTHPVTQNAKPVTVVEAPPTPVPPVKTKKVEDEEMEKEESPSKPVSSAAPTPVSTPESKSFSIGISPLISAALTSNTANEYLPALGLGVNLNFLIDKNLSFGLVTGTEAFPVNTTTIANVFRQVYGTTLPVGVTITGGWTYIPVLGQVKYTFNPGKSGFAPYGFLGGGVAFNNADITLSYQTNTAAVATAETDLLMTSGLGISYFSDSGTEFYLQGQIDIDFTSTKGTDTISLRSNSVTAMVNGNLSDDGPTLFLPIQLGIRFWP